MFFELATRYNKSFSNFRPFATTQEYPNLKELPSDLQANLISLGESYLDFSFQMLPATSFMEFCLTGNRTNYEDLYFAKRRALNALVMAEAVEQNGRFLDNIVNGIFSLCEESAWQLPAHNSYTRDTPQHLLPDSTLPVLDLFSCETGALLATIHYMLGNQLDNLSPVITKRIMHEVHTRIIVPYLSKHFWWMGNGDEPMCNWTIWCTQNVLLSCFLMNQPFEVKHAVFMKSSQSIDLFLKDYGEDGCCDEGAQYYRHAGLCLLNTMEVLNAVTNDAFIHLYQDEKIKNIASYIVNVHVHDEYYINFADCSPIAGRAGVREFLFGKRIQNMELMKFASIDYKCSQDKLLSSEINLFYRLQSAYVHNEIITFNTNGGIEHKDIFYPSVGLFKVHDTTTCLAVKAGDNDDSHNHNDVGSFTIYKHNHPMFIDVGVESYSKKTFSPERYEIWTMQSSYHNLPEIDGIMQQDGANFKATHVIIALEQDFASISMELASAYPINNLLYHRQITMNKNRQIIIEDSWDGCESVILNLMTYEKPYIHGSQLILVASETVVDLVAPEKLEATNIKNIPNILGIVDIMGSASIEIEEIPILDARLKQAWKHNIYRTRINATANSLTLTIH